MQMCHSFTHSGVDTLRNQSGRTRPPASDVGMATAQSEPNGILKWKPHINKMNDEITQKQRTFVAIQCNKYLVSQNICSSNAT